MGLGRAAGSTGRLGRVRQTGIPVGGGVVSLVEVAWGAVRIDGTIPVGRRSTPGRAPVGRVDPGLAVRPDGHRRAPSDREGDRDLLADREAFRCPGPAVPTRRGNRKGVVEKANHTAAQRWWRSLPDDVTTGQAQALLDRFCERVTDRRKRIGQDGNRCTVADLAAAERLRPVPKTPPIAVITVTRKATAQALVHYRGNRYSLPPQLAGCTVMVTHRAGGTTLAVVTGNGVTVAVHPRRADGTGATERTDTHVTALNTAAMAASTSVAPHRSKQRIPPGPDARAAAQALRANNPAAGPGGSSAPVIDLARYARAAESRRTLP